MNDIKTFPVTPLNVMRSLSLTAATEKREVVKVPDNEIWLVKAISTQNDTSGSGGVSGKLLINNMGHEITLGFEAGIVVNTSLLVVADIWLVPGNTVLVYWYNSTVGDIIRTMVMGKRYQIPTK